MIQLVVIVVGLLALAGGGWAWLHNHDEAVQAEYQAKIEAKEGELQVAADKAKVEAANHITDMQAAFDAGEAQAKTVTRTVYVKGQNYVANTAVFSDPNCVVPPDGMLILNSARASLRTPADPPRAVATLPAAGSGTTAGWETRNALPPSDSGHGTVGGVPADARQPDSTHQIPGPNLPAHPKPKPIGSQ